MVYKCIVPHCKGNYNKDNKVSTFKFPEDENLRRLWLSAIPRDFIPTKYSRVCERHFREDQLVRTSEAYDSKTGVKVCANLDKVRLKKDAVPCIFPNCPVYLSNPGHSRESRDQKLERLESDQLKLALSESVKSQHKYNECYSFSNHSEFLKCLANRHINGWIQSKCDDNIVFAIISMRDVPTLSLSASVDINLNLRLFRGSYEVKQFKGQKYPVQISNIIELENILDTLLTDFLNNSDSNSNNDANDVITNVTNILQVLIEKDGNNLDKKVLFLCEQLKLLPLKKHSFRYSTDFVIFCSILYTISPHAYRYLRSTDLLTLPCPKSLHKICANLNCDPTKEQFDAGFLCYLKQKFKLLNTNDKTVILLLDKIYLKSYFDYKGGGIVGGAFDTNEGAKTAHVFMIQSLKSSYKDVAHILPVRDFNAEKLYAVIKKIIIGLHAIGFHVICVVSDNNPINRKAMSFFHSPPKLQIVYDHPAGDSKYLFYLFDSVHILKCLRNNWLNQNEQKLIYPDFSSFTELNSIADFSVLKKLHEAECTNLVKFGYGLSSKTINPSQFERQNVKLTLNIFNELVIEGIKQFGTLQNVPNYETTANFINIILNWWNIVNTKTLYKNVRLNNKLMEPLAPGHENFKYLEHCLAWLDFWKSCQPTSCKLSNETHLAFSHTVYGLIQLTLYCVSELGFKYILPGKLQTDSLEDRFGKYRNLAGSQYLISIRQIFEIESKLRVQSLLPLCLNSKECGTLEITLKDILKSCISSENTQDTPESNTIVANFDYTLNEDDYQRCNISNVLPILTYLSGYCARSASKKLKCPECSQFLLLDKTITANQINENYSLIKNIDRGGLSYPHPDVTNIVLLNYVLINKLISNQETEQILLKCQNQRKSIIYFSAQLVELHANTFFDDLQCDNTDHSVTNISNHILKVSTNIFLNNYVKLKNDKLHESSKKKRKLNTLIGS